MPSARCSVGVPVHGVSNPLGIQSHAQAAQHPLYTMNLVHHGLGSADHGVENRHHGLVFLMVEHVPNSGVGHVTIEGLSKQEPDRPQFAQRDRLLALTCGPETFTHPQTRHTSGRFLPKRSTPTDFGGVGVYGQLWRRGWRSLPSPLLKSRQCYKSRMDCLDKPTRPRKQRTIFLWWSPGPRHGLAPLYPFFPAAQASLRANSYAPSAVRGAVLPSGRSSLHSSYPLLRTLHSLRLFHPAHVEEYRPRIEPGERIPYGYGNSHPTEITVECHGEKPMVMVMTSHCEDASIQVAQSAHLAVRHVYPHLLRIYMHSKVVHALPSNP